MSCSPAPLGVVDRLREIAAREPPPGSGGPALRGARRRPDRRCSSIASRRALVEGGALGGTELLVEGVADQRVGEADSGRRRRSATSCSAIASASRLHQLLALPCRRPARADPPRSRGRSPPRHAAPRWSLAEPVEAPPDDLANALRDLQLRPRCRRRSACPRWRAGRTISPTKNGLPSVCSWTACDQARGRGLGAGGHLDVARDLGLARPASAMRPLALDAGELAEDPGERMVAARARRRGRCPGSAGRSIGELARQRTGAAAATARRPSAGRRGRSRAGASRGGCQQKAGDRVEEAEARRLAVARPRRRSSRRAARRPRGRPGRSRPRRRRAARRAQPGRRRARRSGSPAPRASRRARPRPRGSGPSSTCAPRSRA